MRTTPARCVVAVAVLVLATAWGIHAQRGGAAETPGGRAGGPPPASAVGPVPIVPSMLSDKAAERFKSFKPVTDAMLENPDPADWINWRRTMDAWGYSPLKQVNRNNVEQLQLVWSRPLGPGGNMQPAPLVYQGILYVPQPYGVVQAFDGLNGDLLWSYQRKFEVNPDTYFSSRMRTLAITGDKIIVATNDAHLVALDARTGKVTWDQTVANFRLGYRYTTGALIVKGKIIAGITGCERYKNDICFISAHDPETGKELWRTSTVQRPGDPGEDTWGGLPLNKRAGSDVWITGSYDPKLNLMYWSTAQPKPWARVSRNTDGDALYSNSTLAIDPDTGKIVWYYQFTPGESHDIDDVFENTLIDHDGRTSLFKMGKMGILWEIDRKTGKFVKGTDLGFQTLVEFDPTTGKVQYRADMIPRKDVPIEFCPTLIGVRNWRATAYHPETRALYIPIHPSCTVSVFGEAAQENAFDVYFYRDPKLTGWRQTGGGAHPAMPKNVRGQYVAMDIRSGRILWRHSTETTPGAAALTTAGGLVFGADVDGYAFALDATTGKQLFQTRLMTGAAGYPVTYAIGDTQYVSIPGGNRAQGGAALYVFALPASVRGALR